MQNIFKYIFLPIIIIFGIYIVWKTYFGDTDELEIANIKLKKENKTIQKTRDSLDLVNQELSTKYDSVFKIKENLLVSIDKLKEDYELLERKSRKNLDSAKKWKQFYMTNKQKIEDLKKNRKEPSNQETLDYFKKY